MQGCWLHSAIRNAGIGSKIALIRFADSNLRGAFHLTAGVLEQNICAMLMNLLVQQMVDCAHSSGFVFSNIS